MAFSLTEEGSQIKLVLVGCTGACSAGHNHFEVYYWDKTEVCRVNVVGRLYILAMLSGNEALDTIKVIFEAGFNKSPDDCAGMIWTDWVKVFWTEKVSGNEIWKYVIEKKLAENKRWVKCPKCLEKKKSFDQTIFIDPSQATCVDCK